MDLKRLLVGDVVPHSCTSDSSPIPCGTSRQPSPVLSTEASADMHVETSLAGFAASISALDCFQRAATSCAGVIGSGAWHSTIWHKAYISLPETVRGEGRLNSS